MKCEHCGYNLQLEDRFCPYCGKPNPFAAQHQREMEQRQEAEKTAASLRGKVIIVATRCGSQGRLYGSVTAAEVADALKEQYHVSVDKRKIELAETIRTVGDSAATVKLYPEISAKMTVRVTAQEA